MALAGDDQGVNNGGALSSIGVADEEPVLLADGGGADRVFDEVVVEPGDGVLLVRDERLPVIEQVWAASGGWTAADAYTLKLCAYETSYLLTATMKFVGDEVIYNAAYNVGPKLPQLIGKAEAVVPAQGRCSASPS